MNPSALSSAGVGPAAAGQQSIEQIKAGGFLQGVGSITSGIAGFAQARYQSQVAKINAQIAKQNEEYALQKGETDAMHYGLQASQRMGSIRAAQGSSGLDVNTGSARDVQQSQALVSKLDTQQIRQNAARVAYDYNAQAVSFENQAALDSRAGINSLIGGGIGALSSFVGTSAAIHSRWLQGGQAGMNPASASAQDPSILGGVGVNYLSSGSTWGN